MKHLIISSLLIFCYLTGNAQGTEKYFTLSKDAKKRFPSQFYMNSQGGVDVEMQLKGNKENYRYETYSFKADLSEPTTNIFETPHTDWKKLSDEDKKTYEISESDYVDARIGGTTSFTVLNKALYVRKVHVTTVYNKKTGQSMNKYSSSDATKLKDDASEKYVAFSANPNYSNGSTIVLVSSKEKGSYKLLTISADLSIKESSIELPEPATLVYETLMNDNGEEVTDFEKGNWYLLFAPKEGSVNPNKYTLLKVNNKAEVVQKSEINMPVPAVIIYGLYSNGKSLYFTGGTFPKEKFYKFKPYRDICMTFDGTQLYMHEYLQQNANDECSSFVIVKQTEGKTDWVSETSIKEFKSLAKPSEGGKTIPYKGQFIQLSSGGIFGNYFAVTGQGVEFSLFGKFTFKYKDAFTFLVDNNTGKIASQYTLNTKSKDDKFGVYFKLPSYLKASNDGKSIHCVTFENEAREEETTDFHAFINGYQSFTYIPCYYPAVSTIDLTSLKQTKLVYPGNGEYKSKSVESYWVGSEKGFVFLGFEGKEKAMLYKYDY